MANVIRLDKVKGYPVSFKNSIGNLEQGLFLELKGLSNGDYEAYEVELAKATPTNTVVFHASVVVQYDERLIEKKSNAMLIEYDGRANDFKPARIIKKKEQLRIMLIEKLIYMLISINKKTNIMYANQLTEENFETVINKLYDKLESQGISYERNSVNSKKLCNFAGLCILIDKGE